MAIERVDAGQVYVDLLNKIKKIESEVDPATIEEIIHDLNMIFSIIPAGASQDNKLVTEDEVPADQVNADWNATSGVAEILNKPTIPAAQVNADWNATSGVAEILNKPTIPAAQVNADWNASSGVAEILNKPTIPAAQVNADWNASSGVAEILNKPGIHNPIQQELVVTSSGWTYSSIDKYYTKAHTLTTPLNPDYSPTISNLQYTAGPHYEWFRKICGGRLSNDGTTLTIWAREEPPSDGYDTQVFIQGWS